MDLWVVYIEEETGKLRVSSRSPFPSLYEAQKYAAPISPDRNAKVLVEATQGVGLGLITEHANANKLRLQEKRERKKRVAALREKLANQKKERTNGIQEAQ